jgi:formylglycine-generating enzyme required for sulfatase activity
VEYVTWDDAVDFCNKLTEKDRKDGRISTNHVYRLPSEAEWEYACRAGTTGAVYVDYRDRNKELDWIAWWVGNSGDATHPVKEKWQGGNAFGLYNMLGNVWEWCFDWYGDYPSGDVTDPKGPSTGHGRVKRGGSWDVISSFVRSANRSAFGQGNPSNDIGFRPALSTVR